MRGSWKPEDHKPVIENEKIKSIEKSFEKNARGLHDIHSPQSKSYTEFYVHDSIMRSNSKEKEDKNLNY